jgi:hypothetical protein
MALALILLSFALVSTASKAWSDKRKLGKIYNRLFGDDRQFLQAVHKASKEGKPTSNAVSSKYQKISGKRVKHSDLVDKLRHAVEIGLIKPFIANENDNPFLTWKTNFTMKE